MVVGLAAILNCAPYVGVAGAAANPGFTSTYNFDTTLTGVHAFGVTGNGIVVAIFQGTYGPAENVTISVEIQTCGFFGCNWDGATVGGDCTRLLFVGGNSTCNFNTGNSNTLHRIYMIKNFDGNTIKGNVWQHHKREREGQLGMILVFRSYVLGLYDAGQIAFFPRMN